MLTFKTAIFSIFTFYDITTGVELVELKDEKLKIQIDKFIESRNDCSINELIKKSLKITSKTLEFSRTSKSTDPNVLYKTQKTHCVGYSALINSLINYGLKKMDIHNYESTHWRGKIYFLGFELTNRFNDNFYSDHDFVEITNTKEDVRLRIDPSLYEFTRIGIMNIPYSK